MASIRKRPDGRWRARYRDEAGREHAKHFERKVDGQRWLDEVSASIIVGQYVDPRAGNVLFRDYAEQWRASQVHRDSSAAHLETMLRLHAYPTLGERRLSMIRPSEIQAWVKSLLQTLSPSTVAVAHGYVAAVMKAAVVDRNIASNPCETTKLPEVVKPKVVPLPLEQVEQIRNLLPDRYKAVITVAAGTGLRQGELFGLSVDRLHMLKRELVVDRQLVILPNKPPTLGPPKTSASNRVVPLPQAVLDALAAHLAAYPAGENGLVFTREDGRPMTRQAFGHIWRPVAREVGLPVGTGLHSMRHFYASLLIRYGESVKVVQTRLGHKSATETLDTYAHLWADSEDRTRDAIDSVLGASADSLRTETSH